MVKAPSAAEVGAAHAAIEHGNALGQHGDTAGSVALFEQVISTLQNNADLESRNVVASAMFNKAVAYRFAKQTERAVAAMDAAVARYGEESAHELRYWVALALYNKGFVFQDVHRTEEAVAAFDQFLGQFRESGVPVIRERVADALYQQGRLLIGLDRDQEGFSALEEVLWRFGNAPEPKIQQIIASLIGNGEAQVDLSAPAAHARFNKRLLLDEAVLEEQAKKDTAHAEAHRQSLQYHREKVQRAVEEAAALHAEAFKVLTAYRQELRPFALFLRNFDLEGFQAIGNTAEGPRWATSVKMKPPRVESGLAAALRDSLSLIGIANPILYFKGYKDPLPKLEIRNEVWRAALQELVSGASFIVIQLTGLTAGVLSELQTILLHHKEKATVLILSEDENASDGLSMNLRQWLEVPQPETQSREEVAAQLTAFPRVVREEEVNFEALDASALFADLLQQAQFIKQLSPEQRRTRRKIERLNQTAADRLSRKEYDQAIADLRSALDLNRSVNDRRFMQASYAWLGAALHHQQDFQGAIAAFSEALQLAQQLEEPLEEGMLMRDLGMCCQAASDPNLAIHWYKAAADRLQALSAGHWADATRQLGSVYLEQGKAPEALACFERAHAGYRDLGASDMMLQTRMYFSAAYTQLGRYQEAIAASEEAVALAREINATELEQVALQMIERLRRLDTATPEAL